MIVKNIDGYENDIIYNVVGNINNNNYDMNINLNGENYILLTCPLFTNSVNIG